MKLRAQRLILVFVAAVLAAAARLLAPAELAAFEARFLDAGWRLFARDAAEERLVLIDIDEKSLAALGPWPWPRERLAQLAERLTAAGVAAQVWDLVLDVPREGDERLAAALARGQAVLAVAFAFPGQGEAIEGGHLGSAPLAQPCAAPWPRAVGWRAPAATLAAIPVGHIAYRVEADGVARAVPAYVCAGERAYPALALAGYALAAGEAALQPEAGRLFGERLPEAIPLAADGALLVPYRRRPEAFVAVSAADLLAGRAPSERLAGRIAVVGATALSVGDAVATPLGGAQGGLLVHAELLSGLLDGALPAEGGEWPGLVAALLGLLLLWRLAGRLPAWLVPLGGVVLSLFLLVVGVLAPPLFAVRFVVVAPALALFLAGLLLGAGEAWRLARAHGLLALQLASFLPAPLAARLLRAPEEEVRAETVEVSVLYVDLRNFTAWSEAQAPQQVAALLSRFYAEAAEVIEAHGGVVEALEGDAVLAVWNAFAPAADPAAQALAAARSLRQRLLAWLPATAPEALPPPLAAAIGLDAGAALIGLVGPARRRRHLVIGLPVVRAMRLAALSGELSADILVGPGLIARLPAAARASLVSRGVFLLEGLATPCEIHVLGEA